MFRAARQYVRYTSWPIVAAGLALIVIGVVAISFSQKTTGQAGQSAVHQGAYGGVGAIVFILAVLVPYQKLGRFAYGLFTLTLIMLVAVLFTRPIKGATRWFDLWIVRIQPSEIAKLAYVLMLAWYLRYRDNYRRLRGLLIPFALAVAPMGLVLIEPDLGTALLFLPTLYFVLFMAGAKLKHLLAILAMGVAVILLPVPRTVDVGAWQEQRESFDAHSLGPVDLYSPSGIVSSADRSQIPLAYCRLGWRGGRPYDLQPLSLRLMETHQIGRIIGWLRQGDDEVAIAEGFQLRWSLTTLSAGRWRGPSKTGHDTLKMSVQQLPDERTDFIFSLIGGKWGLVGCLAVLGIYAVIFVFGIEIAAVTNEPFGRLLAVGVVALLFWQVFINVGMTIGLMPITGMTLPLISYGGSSLVTSCAALGLLVNVGQRRPILLSRRPFEYAEKKKPTRLESRKAPGIEQAGKTEEEKQI